MATAATTMAVHHARSSADRRPTSERARQTIQFVPPILAETTSAPDGVGPEGTSACSARCHRATAAAKQKRNDQSRRYRERLKSRKPPEKEAAPERARVITKEFF